MDYDTAKKISEKTKYGTTAHYVQDLYVQWQAWLLGQGAGEPIPGGAGCYLATKGIGRVAISSEDITISLGTTILGKFSKICGHTTS